MTINDPYTYFKSKIISESGLPQNMINVVKELGENSVIFFLFLLIRNTNWKVYRNLNEKGCDIVLLNGKKRINVEVKTRQNIHSTNKSVKRSGKTIQFELSKLEYDSCNIVVGLWFNRNAYFIIEKDRLVKSTSKGNKMRIIIQEDVEGKRYFHGIKAVRKDIIPNNWDVIKKMLKP